MRSIKELVSKFHSGVHNFTLVRPLIYYCRNIDDNVQLATFASRSSY
jgi:hypothetical protein